MGCFFEEDKKIKTNFIKELKKLGEIYYYDPQFWNVKFYLSKTEKSKYFYNEKLNFTNSDLDIDNVCTKIYNDVKDFNGKIIPIGHSLGAFYVYHFSQKYSSKCLFCIYLDNTPLGPVNYTKYPKDYDNTEKIEKIKKYSKYNDEDIELLKEKVYKNDIESAKILEEAIYFKIKSYESIIEKADKFKVMSLFFYNFDLKEYDKDKHPLESWSYYWQQRRLREIDYFTEHNKNNYKAYTFINKGHFLFYKKDVIEIIIQNIKNYIN